MEENNKKVKPDNFLVWAILSTVICCSPLGIVAIVYANKFDTLWYAERYEEAEDALKKAKMWTYVTVGSAAVAALLSSVVMLLTAILGY